MNARSRGFMSDVQLSAVRTGVTASVMTCLLRLVRNTCLMVMLLGWDVLHVHRVFHPHADRREL